MENVYEEKIKGLKEQLSNYARKDIVLAFSGGVDSSILLKMCQEAAKKTGSKVYAVTVQTRLHPAGDPEIARRVCEEVGAIHKLIYVDELEEAGIGENPVNRCYLCKKTIFQKICDIARSKKIDVILEGTNEDDLHVYRPGIKALKELGILSPLADCGITKEEVRRLAKEYEISVAERPSTPCMATRFPYGDSINYEILHQVEIGEQWLSARGYYNVRLRVHGDILRMEVDREDLSRVIEEREAMIEKMKELGFPYITLDLEGFRSGSMDIFIKKQKNRSR